MKVEKTILPLKRRDKIFFLLLLLYIAVNNDNMYIHRAGNPHLFLLSLINIPQPRNAATHRASGAERRRRKQNRRCNFAKACWNVIGVHFTFTRTLNQILSRIRRSIDVPFDNHSNVLVYLDNS